MKKLIIFIISIIIGFLIIVISCSKSTIIDMTIPRNIDTSTYTPRVKSDTTSNKDTARIPISFDVSVDDWEDGDYTEYSFN